MCNGNARKVHVYCNVDVVALFRICSVLLSVMFMSFNPVTLRQAKIVYNFGLSECSRVNNSLLLLSVYMLFLNENIKCKVYRT